MKTQIFPMVVALALLLSPGARSQGIDVRRATPAIPETAPQLVKPEHADINDLARFVAGLPVTSGPLAALEQAPEWNQYAISMNSRWQRFDTGRLQPIRLWAATELKHASTSKVFYPFSGPDFVYVATMFPHASTYVLCGLEPVGDLPSLEKIQPLNYTLGWLQASMTTLLQAGYFVTKDMGIELKMSPLQGTLPILCVMLARSGDRIVSVSHDASHAEIHFVSPLGGPERTLYYIAGDLSNSGMGKKSGLVKFLAQIHPDAVYVKSASYLMHETEFSAVRNLLLSQFSTIVQDDSGIPLKDFDLRRWTLHLYGAYEAPLDIFAKYYQSDLAELYSKSHAPPLTFGAGYHWNPKTATLIVATAHNGGQAREVTTAAPSHTHQ